MDRMCNVQMQSKLRVSQTECDAKSETFSAPLICTVREAFWSEGQLWLLVYLAQLCSSSMQGCGCHSRRLGFQGSRSAGAQLQQRLAWGERALPEVRRPA